MTNQTDAANSGYIRYPTISGEGIVFSAEDDLWRVAASGGRAERLTAGIAEASHARFSPDGRTLAFVGRSEGPAEVYAMPAEGGEARRLTYRGGDAAVVGWQPDGSAILFVSSAGQPSPRMRVLQAVAPQGGEPETLPYGPTRAIAFGPGYPHGPLVLGRNTVEPARWKRYRGGTAGYLYIDPDGSGQFRRLHDVPGNVAAPCWVGERIYFISDHEGMGDVYSCLPSGEDLRRHTRQTDYYARGLSSDGRRLVFHAGGDLFLLDPAADRAERVPVTLAGPRTQRARAFVAPGRFLDSFALDASGKRVALTTRGKAFSLGAEEGAAVQHGTPQGARYRLAAWLADGKRLVAVSDESGEPRLVVFAADGTSPPRTLDTVDVGYVRDLLPSPVGERVALWNHREEVTVVDLATGAARVLDRGPSARVEDRRHAFGMGWSPDGRWLAYAHASSPQRTAIKVADVASGATREVTAPVLFDLAPAFDPTGKYLLFVGTRTFEPVADYMRWDFGFPKGQKPYLVTLRRDTPSPFLPGATDASATDGKDVAKDAKPGEPTSPPTVEIDFEGITDRVIALPVAEGRYQRVRATPKGVLFTSLPVQMMKDVGQQSATTGSLEFYDLAARKQEHLADGVTDFEVTPDGKTLIYHAGERLRVLPAGEKPKGDDLPPGERDKPGRATGWVDLDRAKVSVEPVAEWRQMFREAWRLIRDQFWTADMAGVDWQAIYARYAPLVERLGSRAELSDLFWEMQGELGSSHAYEGGGEYRPHPEYRQGFLGANWEYDAASDAYRVTRLVHGDPWEAEASSPLRVPGVQVAPGDAVVAINGQRLSRAFGPQQALVNQAGNAVLLEVAPADGGAHRTVTVMAAGGEFAARYRDWVDANRRAVAEATGGRVGYMHIPDMWTSGLSEFYRAYLAEWGKDALIVDVRWNGGGAVSGNILSTLTRPRVGYVFQRWGEPEPYFMESPRGVFVGITDENAGSDGDIFSHAWKALDLGPLVGMRTWGGVIGIDPYAALADGTQTTQPEFSFWFNSAGWGVENYGVDPTIPVEYLPQDYVAGRDPQLARAIAEMTRLLGERETAIPTPGPHPQRGYRG